MLIKLKKTFDIVNKINKNLNRSEGSLIISIIYLDYLNLISQNIFSGVLI